MSHVPTSELFRRSSVLNYEQSLMFGRYREDLAKFALLQAEKIRELESKKVEDKKIEEKVGSRCSRFRQFFKSTGDMIFFSLLAITLATLSFVMDVILHSFFECKFQLTKSIPFSNDHSDFSS